MSSKSRKHSQKGKKSGRSHAQGHDPEPAAAASAPAATHAGPLDIPDELVKVPKETSPLRFVLMILLVIVLLVIFVAPNAFFNLAESGGQADGTFMSWNHPEDGRVEIPYSQFLRQKQLFESARNVDPFLTQFGLGMFDEVTDEQVASMIVIDELAKHAGLHISGEDLTQHFRALVGRYYGSVDQFDMQVNRYGGAEAMRATFQQLLRIQRYTLMMGYAASVPDPAKIEESWAEDHVEYAFDYTQIALEDLEEEARAAVPADDALATWFEGLEENRRLAFEEPEKRLPGIAVYRDAETTPAKELLAKYPEPEGSDPEERAEDYYNRVFFTRFVRPEEPVTPPEDAASDDTSDESSDDTDPTKPADGDGGPGGAGQDEDAPAEDTGAGEGDQDAAGGDESMGPAPELADEPLPEQAPPEPYLRLDEVLEQCLAEAPVYFAMEQWLRELEDRLGAGEEIDFKAEVEAMGLGFEGPDAAVSQLDTMLDETWGGQAVSDTIFQTDAGNFGASILLEAERFGVVRVIDVVEPAVPPLEEIKDQVVDLWVKEHKEETALRRLNELRDSFTELPPKEEDDEGTAVSTGADDEEEEPLVRRSADEAAFKAAAESAGLEVARRDWLDKGNLSLDPKINEPPHVYLRTKREYYDLDDDEVPAVGLNNSGEYAFLVRKVGSRPVPIELMSPNNFQNYKGRSARGVASELRSRFDPEGLVQSYGLELEGYPPEDDEELAEILKELEGE